MKKLSKLAIAALVLVLVAVFMQVSLANYTLGDVNEDGRINASDARAALRYSAKLISLTPNQLKAADINFDGKVSAADARTILRVSANLIPMPEQPDTEPSVTEPPTDPPIQDDDIEFVGDELRHDPVLPWQNLD